MSVWIQKAGAEGHADGEAQPWTFRQRRSPPAIATVCIHKHRNQNKEPDYRLTVIEGPSKLDGMGIPKEAARKVEMIDRSKETRRSR
jgi:hypothetical protein